MNQYSLLRGPLALSRLKAREDGLLTYRLKRPDRRGNTVLVLSPDQLLMRLASLIPAPGTPMRTYFGVLAAGSKMPAPVQRPVKWAELLKRVWGIDALACPKCKTRTKAMAVVEDPGRDRALPGAHRGDHGLPADDRAAGRTRGMNGKNVAMVERGA